MSDRIKPTRISNFLQNEDFKYLLDDVKKTCNNFTTKEYFKDLGRYDAYYSIPESIQNSICKKINEVLKIDHKIYFCKLVKYQNFEETISKLDSHKDKLLYDLIISYTVENTLSENWPLGVDEYLFENEINSGIIFDGKVSDHFRIGKAPKPNNEYLTILLIYTVDKNSELAKKQLRPELFFPIVTLNPLDLEKLI